MSPDFCTVPDCDEVRWARGLCRPHYDRARNRGEWPVFRCSECQAELREPAELCGFCEIELAAA